MLKILLTVAALIFPASAFSARYSFDYFGADWAYCTAYVFDIEVCELVDGFDGLDNGSVEHRMSFEFETDLTGTLSLSDLDSYSLFDLSKGFSPLVEMEFVFNGSFISEWWARIIYENGEVVAISSNQSGSTTGGSPVFDFTLVLAGEHALATARPGFWSRNIVVGQDPDPTPVPLPTTAALMIPALLLLSSRRCRRHWSQ